MKFCKNKTFCELDLGDYFFCRLRRAPRLTIQNDTLKEGTEKHLSAAGLSAGQIVCDIGCGNGVMLPYLAKAVGESAHWRG